MKFSGEIHPVAALFPMLADDELDELEADVKANGLLQPITLDPDGRLLDGRNRLTVCERLGIEPTFTVYDGPDPDGYCLSVNIARRHLTKGQIAMVAAKANRLSRNYSQRELADSNGVSQARIKQANVVLEFAPTLADLVVAAAESLDEAYKKAQANKRAAENADQEMKDLAREAPDLHAQVMEERLTLSEALAALRQRQEDHRAAIKRGQDRLRELLDGWVQLKTLPEHNCRTELLGGLTEIDRQAVLEIEAIYVKGRGK